MIFERSFQAGIYFSSLSSLRSSVMPVTFDRATIFTFLPNRPRPISFVAYQRPSPFVNLRLIVDRLTRNIKAAKTRESRCSPRNDKKRRRNAAERDGDIAYVLSCSSRPPTLALVYKYIFMVPYVLCAREQDPVFAHASRFYNREKKMMKKKRENKRNKS